VLCAELTSIRYCVQETCSARHASNPTAPHALTPSAHVPRCACEDFDALYAYLTCGNYDFNYDRTKNLCARAHV